MNKNQTQKQPYRICCVCLGNIVRSPMAENIFRQLTIDHGVPDHYDLDSAGTARYHIGQSPDHRMRRVAAGRGLNYDGSARQFVPADFGVFDLIVPMDTENRADLLYLAKRVKPEMPLCFADDNFGMYQLDEEVADYIAYLQDTYNWPQYIRTTTGKNRHERIRVPAPDYRPDLPGYASPMVGKNSHRSPGFVTRAERRNAQ